jgi:hypothetical protein
LEDLNVKKNVILKFIFIKYGRLDLITLAQERNKWRTLVNAVVNFRVALNAGNFLINLGAISLSIWAVLQTAEENIPITLVNKILSHKRFIVFLTYLFTLNPNM